jgi:hypothetical protein
MRTFDKLIATIPDRRSDACVRPFIGSRSGFVLHE